jgi:hypothetical protein
VSIPSSPGPGPEARDLTGGRGLIQVAGWLAAVAAARVVVTLLAFRHGFAAISDDDYGRVVLAQQFAHARSWDATGSSWLPLPFWIYGGAMMAAGRSLATARVVAVALGVVSSWCLWLAARWFGCSRRGSTVAAILAAALPWGAWLGAATVPDGLTASLVVLGCAGAASMRPGRRAAAALALLAACLSRYEAWPVGAAFAALTARDLARGQSRALLVAALLALAGPLGWMAHGWAHHGDPLFFLERVADYERAATSGRAGWLDRLAAYPRAVATGAPELWAGFAVALAVARRRGMVAPVMQRYRRCALLLGVSWVALVAGALAHGAPTHHPERPLLAIWLVAVIGTVQLVRAAATAPRERWAVCASLAAAAALGLWLRGPLGADSRFVDRSAELAIGARARAVAPGGSRLVVGTDDYGYAAIVAAFGRPEATAIVDDHDPRTRRAAAPAWSARLSRLTNGPDTWIVTSCRHASELPARVIVEARRGSLLLVRLPSSGEPPPPPHRPGCGKAAGPGI